MTAINGLYHICQLIQKILEENTKQMLSVLTVSLEKAVSDSFWKKHMVFVFQRKCEEVGYSVKDVSDHTHKEEAEEFKKEVEAAFPGDRKSVV